MRTKWLSPVLAVLVAGMIATPATAQTIAYTNFLKFDLQSYTSQATAGIFDDDIEMVSDAAKLMNVEGNRLFTSFSNLADPAGLGDNILSYSVDHIGVPGGPDANTGAMDTFDSGSYLIGWMGKYDKDSEYNLSLFYQRNGTKAMFEDLEDYVIGGGVGGSLDAEYTGSITSTTLTGDSTQAVTGDFTRNFDLKRYDERTAEDIDLGVARDVSEDLSVGGRLFFERDKVNSFSEGTYETVTRADADSTTGTQLGVVSRTLTEYVGNGEDAFKYREMGVSLDANYHAWEEQSVGFRVDIFGGNLTNPGGLSSLLPSSRFVQPTGPFQTGWEQVNLRTDWTFTTVPSGPQGGGATVGGAALEAPRETRIWSTLGYNHPGYAVGFPIALESIDDERTGLGLNAKGEYNRVFAGGDINSWAGVGRRKLDISSTAVLVYRSGNSFWWNDGAGSGDREAINTTVNETFTSKRSGDMTMYTLEGGGRWTRDLNSNVSMGLGVVLTRESSKEEYTQTDEDVTVTGGFDDGHPTDNYLYTITSNPAHDERATVTVETDKWDIKDETKTTLVRFPVGTQFHFKKRWTFNMGAMHTIMNTTRETEVNVPAGGNGRVTTTTTSVLNPTPVVTYPSSADSEGTTITDRGRSNRTTYWYGLSVDITDAVQVDINGFLDTNSYDSVLDRGLPSPNFSGSGAITDVDFWRNLAISMKYIFW